MKKLLLSLLLFADFYLSSFCQDILVLKSGDELKVKVSEVLHDVVKYKKWENQDGPMYSETKGNIFMIKYQNGTKDVFGNQGTSNSITPSVSNEETMKNEAVKKLEATIVNDLKQRQKDQIIKVTSIQKTNGVMRNIAGQSVYTIYFNMTLQFIADGWLAGNMFEGYWQGLNVYPSEPNLRGSGLPYTAKKYPRGTVVILGCEVNMSKTDNGYAASNLSIKTERNIGVQEMSNTGSSSQNQTQNQTPIAAITPSEIASLKPAFTGLLSLDTAEVIISLVFNSIEDEIGKGYEIKNKILELLKTNKKIKGISTSGIDTANIPTRYRLECNTKTFYNSSYSSFSKSTVYTADLRLSLYLWEINKSGRVIKGTPSDNKVINTKSFMGGTYISKQGAFDALLPKIEEPLFQKFSAYFPINATITEITDANKKGEPKKVKISCGINQGVLKNFKFKIIDPSRKNEEYDLEVSELFDNYSICKVKDNESIIANRFNAKDKVDVTTIYKLNK